MNAIYIGMSGFSYKDWGEKFYPKRIKKDLLPYYSSQFNTVELNTSFYHLPKKEHFKKWYAETPGEFKFAVKLSRYITHVRKLNEPDESLKLFLSHARVLKEKLGPILIQLPPSLQFKALKIEKFLRSVEKANRQRKYFFALEGRHKSFFEENNLKILCKMLRDRNIALVFTESSRFPNPPQEKEFITANFVYFRFHGPGKLYASSYGETPLQEPAAKIKSWRNKFPIYAYFNNDYSAYAIDDARILRKLAGQDSFLKSRQTELIQ